MKIEAIQDVINKKFVESIISEACLDGQSSEILEKYPNLVAVKHHEYDKSDSKAKFEFGRLDLPELFSNRSLEHTWDEIEENEVQKSLKKQTLFSKITMSLLNKVKSSMEKGIIREGEETQER